MTIKLQPKPPAHKVDGMAQFPRPHVGCSIEGCNRSHYGRGYCRVHWERNNKHGDPLHVEALRNATVRERLDHYSNPVGDCIEWTGYRDKNGYGHMTIDGKDVPVHRAAWEDHGGVIPDGQLVRHSCDNPPCIRISHLLLGDEASNARDMVKRGRSLTGSKNPAAVLTDEQVREIREAIVAGEKQNAIAIRYGIGQSTVSRIKKGTAWRSVE